MSQHRGTAPVARCSFVPRLPQQTTPTPPPSRPLPFGRGSDPPASALHLALALLRLDLLETEQRQRLWTESAQSFRQLLLAGCLELQRAYGAELAAQREAALGAALGDWAAIRFPSWEQWVAALRRIHSAARAGRPTDRDGQWLQLLEAFLVGAVHEALTSHGVTAWRQVAAGDRAVARALHLAVAAPSPLPPT
eukprot:EG_transcript_25083